MSPTMSREEQTVLDTFIDVHELAIEYTKSLPQEELSQGLNCALSAKEERCRQTKRKFIELGGEELQVGDGDIEQWKEAMSTKVALTVNQLEFVSLWLGYVKTQMKEIPDEEKESGKYQILKKCLERLSGLELQSSRELVAVRKMMSPADGGIAIYEERARSRNITQTWISGLLQQFKGPDQIKQPEHLRRDPGAQETFRANLKAIYGCENEEGEFWCPVMRQFYPQGFLTAAHIVPHLLGEEGIGRIFGEPRNGRELLWSFRNGLLLNDWIEAEFDALRLVIIPSEKDNGQGKHYEVFVLCDALMKKKIGPGPLKFSDIHRRALDFNGVEIRPARRFLYFMFVMAMLMLQRKKEPGWVMKVLAASGTSPRVWATAGKYFKRSALRDLANHLCHNGDDEELFKEFDEAEACGVNRRLSQDLTNDLNVDVAAIAAQFVLKAEQQKEKMKQEKRERRKALRAQREKEEVGTGSGSESELGSGLGLGF